MPMRSFVPTEDEKERWNPAKEDDSAYMIVTGVALLLTTHKERAELYQEQFQSKGLTVTIEPAE